MFIENIDEEISMRMLAARDANDLYHLIEQSRDHLREWLPWVNQINSIADCLLFIKDGFQVHAEQTALTAGVFYQDKLVGIAGYNYFDWENRITQIGYWLGARFQGQGVMTRVVRFLTDYAFQELKLNKVEIKIAYENDKSRKIPIRLGYTQEGHLRQAKWLYDHYVDHIIYGMLQEDWQ